MRSLVLHKEIIFLLARFAYRSTLILLNTNELIIYLIVKLSEQLLSRFFIFDLLANFSHRFFTKKKKTDHLDVFSLDIHSHLFIYIYIKLWPRDERRLHTTRNQRISNLQNWISPRSCDVYIENYRLLVPRQRYHRKVVALRANSCIYSLDRRANSPPFVSLDRGYR